MHKKLMTLFAAFGLAVGVHQRGEALKALLSSPSLEQHVGPEIQPKDAICHKSVDVGLL